MKLQCNYHKDAGCYYLEDVENNLSIAEINENGWIARIDGQIDLFDYFIYKEAIEAVKQHFYDVVVCVSVAVRDEEGNLFALPPCVSHNIGEARSLLREEYHWILTKGNAGVITSAWIKEDKASVIRKINGHKEEYDISLDIVCIPK